MRISRVELVGAVAGLPQHYHPGVADPVEQHVDVLPPPDGPALVTHMSPTTPPGRCEPSDRQQDPQPWHLMKSLTRRRFVLGGGAGRVRSAPARADPLAPVPAALSR